MRLSVPSARKALWSRRLRGREEEAKRRQRGAFLQDKEMAFLWKGIPGCTRKKGKLDMEEERH